MMPAAGALPSEVDRYLAGHEQRGLLRFIACGSVECGKSTLLGRLLHESKRLDRDRPEPLRSDARPRGAQGGEIGSRLLLDGRSTEREPRAAIAAYRFFSTDRRRFIVAETPGHGQYTYSIVTGASTARVALILVDARNGIGTQTRRHAFLVSLLGLREVALAVNKLDLVDYSQSVFNAIAGEFETFAAQIGLPSVTAIPLSALRGDNVASRSACTAWYRGPTLMDYLENVAIEDGAQDQPFRMHVQRVNRADPDRRGFSGRVVAGAVGRGDRVRVLPCGKESRVARIVTRDGDRDRSVAGQSITIALEEEIDVGCGDLICSAHAPAGIADQFEATIVWMHEDEMLPGRAYLMKIGARTAVVTMVAPKYRRDVNTLERLAAKTLRLNDIGVCAIHVDQAIPFDAYSDNRDTGGFILVDRLTNETVAAGLLHFALRRSQNIHWQSVEVNKRAHAALKGHRPCVVWFTGLSGSGKSTIANLVERKLHALGRHTYLLDGDNVRHGLNRDLGFTEADRVENIRRVAEVAKLMVDAGLIVLVSFISPFQAERRFARERVEADEFVEVFVDTPLAVAEQRDRKGLYAKARRGELKNFTGFDSPYEAPAHPEVHIDTVACSAEDAADRVVGHLRAAGILDPM